MEGVPEQDEEAEEDISMRKTYTTHLALNLGLDEDYKSEDDGAVVVGAVTRSGK